MGVEVMIGPGEGLSEKVRASCQSTLSNLRESFGKAGESLRSKLCRFRSSAVYVELPLIGLDGLSPLVLIRKFGATVATVGMDQKSEHTCDVTMNVGILMMKTFKDSGNQMDDIMKYKCPSIEKVMPSPYDLCGWMGHLLSCCCSESSHFQI